MNTEFKILSLIIAFTTLLMVEGCQMSSGNTANEGHSAGKQNDGVLLNQSGHRNVYRINITSSPDVMESGKQVVFSLTPQIIGKESQPVPLDNKNGYDIHFIIVNSDLSWFDHRFPGLSDLGSYEQPYTFEKGGSYILFADYTPTGYKDTFQLKNIAVNGYSMKSVTYTEPVLFSVTDKFEVNISPGEGSVFETGKQQSIVVSISNGGKSLDANTLGKYLGSKAVMFMIHLRDKDFLHSFPTVQNGNLAFDTYFTKPGLYRAWLQFQTDNITHTADFVLQVEQAAESK